MSTQRSPGRDRSFPKTALALSLVLLTAVPVAGRNTAAAQENKILVATKSALYGAAAGLLLGGVTALVVKDDDRDNAIRWGIVLGTFTGFAYGVYDATHADKEFSLARADAGGRAEAAALISAREVPRDFSAGFHAVDPARPRAVGTGSPASREAESPFVQPRLSMERGRIPW